MEFIDGKSLKQYDDTAHSMIEEMEKSRDAII